VILVDTSIWVDHLRARNKALVHLLDTGQVLTHPFVIGELALGNLRQRGIILDTLRVLPQAIFAAEHEVLHFIEQNRLFGIGIGYVDAHLLAAARLTTATTLWTRDKRLSVAASRLSLAANLSPQSV
jgi:predicted nucleic acid-binding protein